MHCAGREFGLRLQRGVSRSGVAGPCRFKLLLDNGFVTTGRHRPPCLEIRGREPVPVAVPVAVHHSSLGAWRVHFPRSGRWRTGLNLIIRRSSQRVRVAEGPCLTALRLVDHLGGIWEAATQPNQRQLLPICLKGKPLTWPLIIRPGWGTGRSSLTSEGSLVRTQLRLPGKMPLSMPSPRCLSEMMADYLSDCLSLRAVPSAFAWLPRSPR
jgi:hypothetical protein